MKAQIHSAFTGRSSFFHLAQVNFDHFGQNAVTVYNAGQYEALKETAAGNLEKSYAMNAFAGHWFGDCFASGHFRTPGKALHGSENYMGAAWAFLNGSLQTAMNKDGFKSGIWKAMIPDLLSMVSI